MEGFHYRDGLYFKRNADRSVTIIKTKTPHVDCEEIEFTTTIDEFGWASVIASVSELGEGNLRFYRALEWHSDVRYDEFR